MASLRPPRPAAVRESEGRRDGGRTTPRKKGRPSASGWAPVSGLSFGGYLRQAHGRHPQHSHFWQAHGLHRQHPHKVGCGFPASSTFAQQVGEEAGAPDWAEPASGSRVNPQARIQAGIFMIILLPPFGGNMLAAFQPAGAGRETMPDPAEGRGGGCSTSREGIG